MEPDYVVIGRHEQDGIVFELVVLKDDIALLVDNGIPMWLHNPKVRVSKTASPGEVNEIIGPVQR